LQVQTQGGSHNLSSSDWLGLSPNGLGNLATFSDDFRAAAYGKFVHGNGKVYSQKFYGNQYLSKWGVQASKTTSLSYAKVVSRASTTLAVVGALGTLYDGLSSPQGWQNHHTADLLISGVIYGLAAAVPVAGWIVGGAYFIGDVTSYAISGKSLTQNIFD
jgi:hypothetical protein